VSILLQEIKLTNPMIFIHYIRVVAHILKGIFVVICLFPMVGVERKERLVRQWCQKLLDIFNISIDTEIVGELPKNGALIVSNHISWLDIHAISAICSVRFVAKSEVARWPIFGLFAKKLNTFFINRESKTQARKMIGDLSDALKSGDRICVFPEGTSSDGTSVLNFHSNFFESAIQAQVECIPLGILYENLQTGEMSTATAFIGDMGLIESISKISRSPALRVRLLFNTPCQEKNDRKALAREAFEAVTEVRLKIIERNARGIA